VNNPEGFVAVAKNQSALKCTANALPKDSFVQINAHA
jgi:hypothetical protein